MDYTNEIYKQEADEAQLPRTESRERMWETNKRDINKLTYFNTITCNMDRQNNAGMILYDGPKGDSYRLLTAREAFLLMGFSEKDYENVKELGLSYRKTIKLAGNSIVVPVLEAIFKAMFGDEEECKK
jgi:DNA (cytosine-5)-methyltransferase 1